MVEFGIFEIDVLGQVSRKITKGIDGMTHIDDFVITIKLGISLLKDQAGDIITNGLTKLLAKEITHLDPDTLATLKQINPPSLLPSLIPLRNSTPHNTHILR
jgi:hypothetical protein